MKLKIIESVNPAVLYKRLLKFNNLNPEELEDLLSGVRVAFDRAYERLKEVEFSYARYRLVFSSRLGPDFRYLANPLIGTIQLNQAAGRGFALPAFRKSYRERLREVLQNYEENSLDLEASVIGFKDAIAIVRDHLPEE